MAVTTHITATDTLHIMAHGMIRGMDTHITGTITVTDMVPGMVMDITTIITDIIMDITMDQTDILIPLTIAVHPTMVIGDQWAHQAAHHVAISNHQ